MSAPAADVRLRSLRPYLADHWGTLAVVAGVSLLASLGALAQPLLVRRFIDGLSAGRSPWPTVALLLLVMVVAAVLAGVSQYLLQRTAEGVVLTTRVRLAARLLRLPVAEYDRRRMGDLISRVGADTTLLRAVVTSGLVELASGLVVVVGALALMTALSPWLLLVTLLATAVGVLGVVGVARRVRSLSKQALEAIGRMTAAVERALGGVRTIRAAQAEERETASVAAAATEAYQAGVAVARLEAVVMPLSSVAVQTAFLAVLGVGGAQVATGSLSLGDLIAFVLLLFLLVQPLAQGLNAYTTIQSGLGALSRIEEVLALPAEPDTGEQRLPPPPGSGRPLLELRGVWFGYPDGPSVLHDVSFAVPRGARVALVGPSGAGKSTVLALVERFYDVDAGAVLLDGVDVRDVPRGALRARLGLVEQEAPVLAGSLRDNLLLGDPAADDERLMTVLRQVNLDELVARAPAGLSSEVGDAGVLLSGGERQRLALARALLTDAELLLLDEPTANLDARNEAALRRAVESSAVGRTLLVVAHRLATVVDSDLIVVLEHGRVVATGRHDELVAADPLYRELAAHQLLV